MLILHITPFPSHKTIIRDELLIYSKLLHMVDYLRLFGIYVHLKLLPLKKEKNDNFPCYWLLNFLHPRWFRIMIRCFTVFFTRSLSALHHLSTGKAKTGFIVHPQTHLMLVHCLPTVYEPGPALNQHCFKHKIQCCANLKSTSACLQGMGHAWWQQLTRKNVSHFYL